MSDINNNITFEGVHGEICIPISRINDELCHYCFGHFALTPYKSIYEKREGEDTILLSITPEFFPGDVVKITADPRYIKNIYYYSNLKTDYRVWNLDFLMETMIIGARTRKHVVITQDKEKALSVEEDPYINYRETLHSITRLSNMGPPVEYHVQLDEVGDERSDVQKIKLCGGGKYTSEFYIGTTIRFTTKEIHDQAYGIYDGSVEPMVKYDETKDMIIVPNTIKITTFLKCLVSFLEFKQDEILKCRNKSAMK